MTRRLLDDCFLHDQDRLRHADALALLADRIMPVTGIEQVGIADAAGRVLAEQVLAVHPVPYHTNAAVDGFAFLHATLEASITGALPLAGRAAAGHPLSNPNATGTAVRIFTGAVLPEGCDTVVMQEDVALEDWDGRAHVLVPRDLKRGANVRKAGEDVAAGHPLFETGHVLRPQDVAALASVGRSAVACHRRLRVAIVSTGDEIIRPGAANLEPGQVFDANAPMLVGLVRAAGGLPDDLGVLPDDPNAIRTELEAAAQRYDVILTSGGASRGEEDHLAAVLDRLGKRHLWQLAVKPGRPMMFGQIGDCVMIGLPGNPVAVFVCFLMYVFPMLRRLGGGPFREPRRFPMRAAFGFAGRKPGRREFWRGMLVSTQHGPAVDKFARDGSGLISGLRAADGLIDIPEDHGDVAEGDLVDFIPFSEFGIQSV